MSNRQRRKSSWSPEVVKSESKKTFLSSVWTEEFDPVKAIKKNFNEHFNPQNPKNSKAFTCLVLALSSFILVSVLWFTFGERVDRKTKLENALLMQNLRSLKADLTFMDPAKIRMLQMMYKGVYQRSISEPRPMIIMMVGEKAVVAAFRFAQLSFDIAKNPYTAGYATVKGGSSRGDMHNRLMQLSTHQHNHVVRVAVVEDGEKLQWDSVLVLHAFGDADTSPVKNLLMFVTFAEYHGDCSEEAIHRHIFKRWVDNPDADEDNISPILARIDHFLCV